MLDFLFNMLPEWLFRAGTPMNTTERRFWERIRRFGVTVYLSFWTLGMGGLLLLVDLGSTFVQHDSVNRFFVGFGVAWWMGGGLVVGVIDWHFRERRFRLAMKQDSVSPTISEVRSK